MAPNISDSSSTGKPSGIPEDKPRRVFARASFFLRQVIDELRKVVTPTRGELVNYTVVVLVFVVIVMAIITFLDLLFGWGISWVFGDGSTFLS